MKTFNKVIASAIILVCFSAKLNAQSTATATTTATLLTPISIVKTVDLNFGTLAASNTAGTVALDYNDVRTPSASIKLLPGTSAQKTAQFKVDGEGTSAFTITIPTAAITLQNTTTTGTSMTVSNFECEQTAVSNLVAGTKTLKVKAILNVGANQAAGVYENATGLTATALFVTVNYQ